MGPGPSQTIPKYPGLAHSLWFQGTHDGASGKKPVKILVDSLSNMEIFDPSKCIHQGNLIFSLNWK